MSNSPSAVPPLNARLLVVLGILAVVLMLTAAVAIGTVTVPPLDVWRALRGEGDATTMAIVRDLRMPRALLAALVGMGLSMSGGALQGTLRNPLAEPFLLGVSGGAAVGAVIATAVGVTAPLLVTRAAFGGAALATILVSVIARLGGGGSDTRLLLMAGVVVGAFANAAILVALADAPPERLRGALWWMMGSAADATWGAVMRLAVAVVALGTPLIWWARELDVLAMGDDAAAALGVDTVRATRRVFLIASWLAAATVAAAGLVGFVGLVVPNLARALGARQHRSMLLVSAVFGAALMIGADILARTVRAPADLPLGAVTALIGVPFFLLRLRRLSS